MLPRDSARLPAQLHAPELGLAALERTHRRQLLRALLGLCSVVLTGVIGFHLIEGWGFGRSLYFTLITITTVGYGDEGISDEGRAFAVSLILVGIGIASYTLALVMQSAVTDPFTSRKRMQRKIDRTTDHVVLCGYGRMGQAIADELEREGVRFVVVEEDHEAYQRAVDQGRTALDGDACCDEVLRRAGVQRARFLVAAAHMEAVNILIALSARSLNAGLTIVARAEDDESVRKLQLAGADRVVTPHRSGGRDIAHSIAHPGIASFLARTDFGDGELAMAELRVGAGSELEGVELAAYARERGDGLSFVALERAGEPPHIPPRGSEPLRAGDRLLLAGNPEQVDKMLEEAQPQDASDLRRAA